jgi:Ca2+-binding EF-hand superfamily protein
MISEVGCSESVIPFQNECSKIIAHSREIIEYYDLNHDGRIDRREWERAAKKISSETSRINQKYNSVGGTSPQDMFRQRDINGDGYLDLSEFARIPTSNPPNTVSCLGLR